MRDNSSRTHARLRWLLGVAAVLAGLALSVLPAGCGVVRTVGYMTRHAARAVFTEEGRLERKAAAAGRASERGEHARAERLYAQLRKRRPSSAHYAFRRAGELAALGRDAEAFEELAEAANLGFDESWQVEEEPALRRLRVDPRMHGPLETMEQNEEKGRAEWRAAVALPEAASVPTFTSLGQLQKALAKASKEDARQPRPTTSYEHWAREKRREAREVAWLRRYVEEHQTADDSEEAALALLRARVRLAGDTSPWWQKDLAAAVRLDAEALLARSPAPVHAAEARLYRTLATLQGTVEADFDWQSGDAPAMRCEETLRELQDLASGGSSDPWAVRALGYQALCLAQIHPEDPALAREALGRFREATETPSKDGIPIDWRLRSATRALVFRLDGAPEFTARTLEGTEVSLAAMKGKVLLLEFWGPG